VNWLNNTPFSFGIFQNLTIANMIWSSAFLVAGIYFAKLAKNAWKAYKYLSSREEVKIQRLLALGRFVSQLNLLGMAIAGLVVGIAAAAAPRQAQVTSYTIRQAVVLMALLSIPILGLAQAIIQERIYKIATKTLRSSV
jgi:hypothetical protein